MKLEHGIIALLAIVLLYYVYSHESLLSDLNLVPDHNNPELKALKEQRRLCGPKCHAAAAWR